MDVGAMPIRVVPPPLPTPQINFVRSITVNSDFSNEKTHSTVYLTKKKDVSSRMSLLFPGTTKKNVAYFKMHQI